MALVHDDVTAARRAVQQVERSAEALARHYGDTVDVRRLRADAGRLAADLDLLCGAAPPPAAVTRPAPAAVQREKIADASYTHDFWMDAEDEGLGRGQRSG
jgi:hypothetical protein